MAIVFAKQKKRQKVLAIVFFSVILITVFILWYGFYREETIIHEEDIFLLPPREINIDFEAVERAKGFQLFEEIEMFKEEVGRENPFLPY